MDSKRTITLKVNVTPEEFKEFEAACEEEGFFQSAIARWLIRQWLSSRHGLNVGQSSILCNGQGPRKAQP